MGAWPRSWWQKIKQRRVAIIVTIAIVVVAVALIIVGYLFDWTGFNGYNKVTIARIITGTNAGTVTRTEAFQPGKTLWDWLQLLIIPLVLAVIALLFNRATTRTEQKIATERYEQDKEIASRHYHQDQQIAARRYEDDRRIALDKQREDLLQTYLDRMSELLLEKNLRSSQPDAEVRNVARVRTITILFQLDARRIGYVFAFLNESGLMTSKPNEESIVSLSEANLEKINFSQANLSRADLNGANLSGSNLKWADFSLANLSAADLSRAYSYETNLWAANLRGANLRGANLITSSIEEANLEGADLKGARVSEEQLKKVRSLEGAIMPDGSKHP
jgi:hypothetical protein